MKYKINSNVSQIFFVIFLITIFIFPTCINAQTTQSIIQVDNSSTNNASSSTNFIGTVLWSNTSSCKTTTSGTTYESGMKIIDFIQPVGGVKIFLLDPNHTKVMQGDPSKVGGQIYGSYTPTTSDCCIQTAQNSCIHFTVYGTMTEVSSNTTTSTNNTATTSTQSSSDTVNDLPTTSNNATNTTSPTSSNTNTSTAQPSNTTSQTTTPTTSNNNSLGNNSSDDSSNNKSSGTSSNNSLVNKIMNLFKNLFGRGSTDGTTNGEVSALQQLLGIEPTGYFGPITQNGLANYQSANGIPNTGYFGPLTQASMNSGLGSSNPDSGAGITSGNASDSNGLTEVNSEPGTVGGNPVTTPTEGKTLIVRPCKTAGGCHLALDTDGTQSASWDSTHQSQTSYQPGGKSLNAFKDSYVVVPVGSSIPLGTPTKVIDHTTGKTTLAVVGDRGPRFGEVSVACAKAIGEWQEGKGNAINNPKADVEYVFYLGGKSGTN
ncbi:MAG: peptidoglycan-binding protein [Candidatus Paceibacterota bacterium]